MKRKVSMSWSGGKDSALALHTILKDPAIQVQSLHTSFNDELKRVGMHGTPEELIMAQAEAISLPLHQVYIPSGSNNEQYEAAMLKFYQEQKEAGIEAIVFGDIFLADLKKYREELLRKAGLEALFPLWQQDSRQLIYKFLAGGFKTCLCALDTKYFGEADAGRVLDEAFIASLPAEVDPCGEKGEFHTFAFDGPIFSQPVSYYMNGVAYRSYSLGGNTPPTAGFWFADLQAGRGSKDRF